MLRSPLTKYPRDLLELFSPLPKCPSNTFGAKGLEEFFDFLFFFWKNLGFESAFGRPNHKIFAWKKRNPKKFWKQLDGASITIGAITGSGKNLEEGFVMSIGNQGLISNNNQPLFWYNDHLFYLWHWCPRPQFFPTPFISLGLKHVFFLFLT